MLLRKLIFGRRLANWEFTERKIREFEGVPAIGLDALASSAYGPEAALTILMPLGAAGTAVIGWIMAPILGLLAILYISYRQTIRAYPTNGGAYIVARENLGTNASLLAAAALMVDYILNVAVGISAGIAALTSAIPALHPYTLPLCLAILAGMTIINLRGALDAGRVFGPPTYLFVGSFAVILAIGIAKAIAAGGNPEPIVQPPQLAPAQQAIGPWLLVRAFAAGCTAMTGVEAVSNGVSAFREPVVTRAHRTLTAIIAVLWLLLAGIAYLSSVFGIGAMDQTQAGYQSVLSQLAGAVVGREAFYYVAITTLLCVLCLSANTSFIGFPQMCRLVAQDDFLPRPFAVFGRRLVFSAGILYLAACAGILLIAFGGITDRLIPLFAIGAFLTFTLSQAGMVVHWYREAGRRTPTGRGVRHRARLVINGLGALCTGFAVLVIMAAKFTEGAWITVVAIPGVLVLLRTVNRYYVELDRQLREDGPIDLKSSEPPIVFVATEWWNRLTDRAVQFAIRLSPNVAAVHMMALSGPGAEEKRQELRRQWLKDVEIPAKRAGLPVPQLMLLEEPYRRIEKPLLELIESTAGDSPDRSIAVLIPEVVKRHWWQHLLHNRRARRLRSALLRYGGSRLIVINVPWYLEEPSIEEALKEEREDVQGRRGGT